MSEHWFTSDLHLGHENILKFEPAARPFETLEEMHEAIVDRWNSVVKKYDKVFVLGDFAFGKQNISIAARLNGQKRLILGNHDVYPMAEYLKYFKTVHGSLFWYNAVLTHIPVHSSQLEGRSDFNIHGHLHSKRILTDQMGKFVNDERYINVSAEQNNLTPIHADILLKKTDA